MDLETWQTIVRLPAVQWVQALAVQRRRGTPTRASATAAAVLAVPPAVVGLEPLVRFRRTGTTWHPHRPDEASALVTTGANAVTRNPMYVGLAGLLVAHAVHRRSVRALLPAALFVVSLDRGQVRREEEALAAAFGQEWEDYRDRVPRWVDARTPALVRKALAPLVGRLPGRHRG
ncbi:methyltransferase family protein [Nocardioides bruguierae]|uniref:Isoprenylcysteine carboxylmethyltransferase family protein n=1 Tax=Nocardioides bruguierae TaxID=2945102 RepID=A0A9X2DB13_9ACTN|nr:isoprenylcysteine carboxylmethyltransferase family protein [Nocardioides bruguierae]MCM0622646.1 isoprenylcysteine carboxylmethyltransferase family protein [Nocardioides bruguierae]